MGDQVAGECLRLPKFTGKKSKSLKKVAKDCVKGVHIFGILQIYFGRNVCFWNCYLKDFLLGWESNSSSCSPDSGPRTEWLCAVEGGRSGQVVLQQCQRHHQSGPCSRRGRPPPPPPRPPACSSLPARRGWVQWLWSPCSRVRSPRSRLWSPRVQIGEWLNRP